MIVFGIGLNLCVAVGTLTGLWLIYLRQRNASIVDLGWAIGLTLMGLVHHLRGEDRSASDLIMVVLV